MPNEELLKLCQSLEEYSVDDLEKMVAQAELDAALSDDRMQGTIGFIVRPDFIKICTNYLRKNSARVNDIIKKYHSDVTTMVYELALVVGPQLMETGQIKSMTVVVALLIIIGKRGYDKFVS